MKAIRVHQNGGPEVLKLEEVEIGAPGPGQALVQISHIGINFVDIYFRRGTYPEKPPYTPGWEASGTVIKVGEGVSSVKVGDRVAYAHQRASYAEQCLANADGLIVLPKDFSFEVGAAFPLQGMTAHYLLHEFHAIKPKEYVLIHAAAGGMGLLLVQWAKHIGATVIGTVSSDEKAEAARKAGADEVINYTKQDFVAETQRITDGQGANLIIDGVGQATFSGNLHAVCRRGHIVIFGAASGPADPIVPNALMVKSISISGGSLMNYMLTRNEMLMRAQAVIEGMQQGWLQMTINRVLPLGQASEAHRLLEDRKTIGKVLLQA